jgi:hypothetical protein
MLRVVDGRGLELCSEDVVTTTRHEEFKRSDCGKGSAKKKTYIIKPEDRSQGNGIFMVQNIRDLERKFLTKSNPAAVCQSYLSKPLLLDGFKFDIRVYVLVVGGSSTDPLQDPPRVFLCREGLARFCAHKYVEPSQENLQDNMSHLTNYAINKRSEDYVHAGDTLEQVLDPQRYASKRPLTAVLKQLEAERKDFSSDGFYKSLVHMVGIALAASAPALVGTHRACITDRDDMRSFHVLGFDVILSHTLVPYILEVNNNPSLSMEEIVGMDPEQSVEDLPKNVRAPLNKPCRCAEMQEAHYHQKSLVDLYVKKMVMTGAFRLLEQINQGVENPSNDAYIAVNIAEAGGGLYGMLCRVGQLFFNCGGAPLKNPKAAFNSSALRRHLGSLAGFGTLAKHDFDSVSRRFRDASSAFTFRDVNSTTESLRLFDFVQMVLIFAKRAFPLAGSSRDALLQALKVLDV